MANKNAVTVTFLGDASKLRKTVGEVGEATDKVESKFSSVKKVAGIAGVALGGAALAAIPDLYRLGNELESMGAKAATVFGDSTSQVESWAKKNATAMGLTKREATGLAANFADLLVPMGFTQKQAADMSTDVVGLSGALSAWSNGQRSAAEVSQILSKAMLGERDGLKELGISISEADVQARLLKNGTAELTGAALEQAKATATSQLIFEKSTDAQKAFADSTKTNAERALEAKARMGEFKDTLAVALVPVMGQALEVGMGILNWLTNLSPEAKAVMGVVAGLAGTVLVIVQAVKAWTAVQAALNVVMSANPIGLVVVAIAALVAGVVWAYKNVDWFREGVQGAFAALGDAARWLGRVFSGIWDGIVSGFVWVANNVKRLAGWIADNAINPVIRATNMVIRGMNLINPGKDIPSIPVIAMAQGGMGTVTGPTLFLAGEAGTEDFAFGPHSKGGLSGTGGSVTINVNVSAPTGQIPREQADYVARAVEQHLRRGGAIAGLT